MSDLETQFNSTVDKVRNAPANGDFKPSNMLKLKMYALYRQATDGDVTGKRPGMRRGPLARAKFDAWSKARGLSRDAAMRACIKEVDKVEAQYS